MAFTSPPPAVAAVTAAAVTAAAAAASAGGGAPPPALPAATSATTSAAAGAATLPPRPVLTFSPFPAATSAANLWRSPLTASATAATTGPETAAAAEAAAAAIADAGGPTPAAAARRPVGLVWLRRDLRLHDHPALAAAARACRAVLPLIVVPPAPTVPTDADDGDDTPLDATAAAAAAMATALAAAGSGLAVRVAPVGTSPADVATAVVAAAVAAGAGVIYAHAGRSVDEAAMDAAVSAAAEAAGVAVELHWTGTLHTPADLPVGVPALPPTADGMWRLLQGVPVAAEVPTVGGGGGGGAGLSLPPLPPAVVAGDVHLGTLPVPVKADVGAGQAMSDGGEAAALAALAEYVAGKSLAVLDGGGRSTGTGGGRRPHARGARPWAVDTALGRLAPYLAVGALSPRRVWHAVVGANATPGGGGAVPANQSLRGYVVELELALADHRTWTALRGVLGGGVRTTV